ncbi:MAG: LamG domain-containing protein [Verrucomicrobiales bacterium]|nr:LamG domain-containing protein [Verrucomicrobiales bacterium]
MICEFDEFQIMDFSTRFLPVFSILFLISAAVPGVAFDQPNFDECYIEKDALHLDSNLVESLVEALNSVVCNFPDSRIIDSDLQERALALALCLDPLSVNARRAHARLSNGQQPDKTAYFTDSISSVAERLWSMAGAITKSPAEPEAENLSLFLRELSLLLHPAPPQSRIDAYKSLTGGEARPWEKMVKLQPGENPSSRKLNALFSQKTPTSQKPAPPNVPTTPPAPATKPPPVVVSPEEKPAPPLQHLIYLCDFEKSDGSVDQSPRKNHGRAEGVSFGPGRSPNSSRSLQFRSYSDKLILPIDICPAEVPEVSVCMWVKTEGDPKRNAEVFSTNDRSGLDRAIVFERRKDKPFTWGVFRGADGVLLNENFSVPTNQWMFVAATFSHQTMVIKLYIDGKMAETRGCHGRGLKEIYIGNGNPAKGFTGLIDDICIFNRILDRNEIQSIRSGARFQKFVAESFRVPPQSLQPHRRPLPVASKGKSLSDGLVYACNFEESDGTLDQSGEGNHGLAVNVKRVDGVAENQHAAYFGGDRHRLEIAKSIRPVDMINFTVSAWFKPEKGDRNIAVLFSPGAGSQRGFQNRVSREHNDEVMWAFSCGAGGTVWTEKVEFNKWTHVAAVYEHLSLRARFYINGKEYASDNAGCGWGRNYFAIARSPGYGNPYKGAVDNLLVYDRALLPEEVRALYSGTGASSIAGPANKISTSGGKMTVQPSYIANQFAAERHPGFKYAKHYFLDAEKTRGELQATFDLSTLKAQAATFSKCFLRAKVADFEEAATVDPIVLSNSSGIIASRKGAAPTDNLSLEIPLSKIDFSKPLQLTLRSGNDEVILEKDPPNAVRLVFE